MVDMKTELALDRQKKVVEGFDAAFTALTPRAMAGCLNWRSTLNLGLKLRTKRARYARMA